jgi:deazaflavin-dependent oxidoreductase (nitroreductase family)
VIARGATALGTPAWQRVCEALAMALRHVDPLARRGWLYRTFVRVTATRPMTWLSRTRLWSAVMWNIDPILMRLTRGRLGTALLVRTALLETIGANTGLQRRNAVIYFHDQDRVIIIPSQAGRPENPSWFYNALANPEVVLGGEAFRAEVVEGEDERARLWELADRVFPAFAAYRVSAGRAGRTIPILRLVPR